MTIVVIGGISLLELINRGGVLTPGGTTFEGDHLRGERPTIDCDDQDSDDHLLNWGAANGYVAVSVLIVSSC